MASGAGKGWLDRALAFEPESSTPRLASGAVDACRMELWTDRGSRQQPGGRGGRERRTLAATRTTRSQTGSSLPIRYGQGGEKPTQRQGDRGAERVSVRARRRIWYNRSVTSSHPGAGMPDQDRTREELLRELVELRRRTDELERIRAEHVRTDEALRDHEHRYRALMQSTVHGLWHIDTEGYTLYLNRAMCAILEVDGPEGLAGLTIHHFLSPESLPVLQREHEKRARGIASSYEVELVGARGGRREMLVSGTPILSDGGGLQGTIGVFTDITERKRAQEKIASSERLYRALIESTNSFVFALDPDGRFEFVNRFWTEKIGYSPEEIIGTNVFDLIAPASRPVVRECFGRVLAGEFVSDLEFRSRTRDGGFIEVLTNLTPLHDGSGRVTSMLGTGIDITERKGAQEALRESEARYRALFESAGDGIFLIAGGWCSTAISGPSRCSDAGARISWATRPWSSRRMCSPVAGGPRPLRRNDFVRRRRGSHSFSSGGTRGSTALPSMPRSA